MTRPQEALTEPQSEVAVPDMVAFVLGGNYASPAQGVYWVIEKVTNVDVPKWIASQIAGDWEAVSRAADAAGNLATFNQNYHDTIKTDWDSILESSWQGNAADKAQSYFHNLAGQIKWQISGLNEIQRILDNASDAMSTLAQFLADLVQFLSDLAIIWIIESLIAMGPNPDPTGVSRAAALTAMAATGLAMYKNITKGVTIIAGIFDLIVGLWSGGGVLSRTSPEPLPELGAKSYDHPGA
ncbi:WXG100 family type VII secretion target [Nocardia sp. NPDC057440]|uniref:WXG100 family type VII secretion target n=1 Tax=Nocardia sp. NPDC057440 TaxID=3346134 RepID=UPI003670D5E4